MSAAGEAAASSGAAAGTPAKGELKERATRGSAWTLSSFVIGNFLRLGSNLVLAHVLFPEAFALVALASIVLQALQMFSDVGIGQAVIQHPRGRDPEFLNTAWTLQVLRGLALWGGTIVVAWPVAEFYEEPLLVWIIPASGLSFISTGLQSTKLFTLGRELELARITILGLAETVVKTAITVAWALIWPSVWAIIGGSIVSYFLFMIATHTLLPGARNRFAWERKAVRDLAHFGGWVFASTAFAFLAMQSDRLILGKIGGMSVLGVYSIAYMFSRLPYDIGTRLVNQVQFPALSEVFRRDPSRLQGALVDSRRVLLAVSQFGVVGIMVVAPWFFLLLYDERYAAASTAAPLLAATVWVAILHITSNRALLAMGDSRSLAISSAANCVVTLPACVAGFHAAGVTGFIVGVGLGNAAGYAVVNWALRRRSILIGGQDLRLTGMVLLLGGVCTAIPYVAPAARDTTNLRLGLGVVGLTLSAWYLLRVMLPFVRERARGLVGPAPSG